MSFHSRFDMQREQRDRELGQNTPFLGKKKKKRRGLQPINNATIGVNSVMYCINDVF